MKSVGELSNTYSQIVLKYLYLTRIGRLHILWSVKKFARSITKWTKTCDKRLNRLISYFHHICEYRRYCHVKKKKRRKKKKKRRKKEEEKKRKKKKEKKKRKKKKEKKKEKKKKKKNRKKKENKKEEKKRRKKKREKKQKTQRKIGVKIDRFSGERGTGGVSEILG